jgi:hypothetical protein
VIFPVPGQARKEREELKGSSKLSSRSASRLDLTGLDPIHWRIITTHRLVDPFLVCLADELSQRGLEIGAGLTVEMGWGHE